MLSPLLLIAAWFLRCLQLRRQSRMRRQYPAFRWPFDEASPQRVAIMGAGSGHQTAQALLTLRDCQVID